MKFSSQRIAYGYFAIAAVMFLLQAAFGLITGAKYVWDHDPLISFLPFNTSRAIHLNFMIFWIIAGFMGGAYYLAPEETESELYSPTLATFQLILFSAAGLAAIVGYFFGWTWGMPFLEQPTVLKAIIVLVFLLFLFNIGMTYARARRRTVILATLVIGLFALTGLFLAGVFFMRNLTVQFYYWWWVIHLWGEVAWALVAAAMLAFMLLKLTGVERDALEKWLYIELGLALFTGIVSTGHHYYWIGTPRYWLWVGAAFSVVSPLPILLMTMDTLRTVRERKIQVENKPALYWTVGSVGLHFFGAGVWGFAHSLPQINKWSHGTQFTSSHAHFAFYGAFAMLDIGMFYFALLRDKPAEDKNHASGLRIFWLINLFMLFIIFSFTVAGVVQVYLQRISGMDYLTVQGYIKLWYTVLWISGWGFFIGVILLVIQFFKLYKKIPAFSGKG